MCTSEITPYVLYHANCVDGFTAAWLFHKAIPTAILVPVQYGEQPPEIPDGQRVYIVDFSYARDVMDSMDLRSNRQLVVLDHHKTARDACEGARYCHFDMDECGATLALEYLRSHDTLPDAWPLKECVEVIRYVKDRDLWRWELPGSKEVNAAIRSYPFDTDAWDSLMQRDIEDLRRDGEAIQRYRTRLIDSHVANATTAELAGFKVPIVHCTAGEIISEVAETLAEGQPFAACFFDTQDKYRVFSLRSRGAEAEDVSEIAKRFGGGGHKHAAGFRVPVF